MNFQSTNTNDSFNNPVSSDKSINNKTNEYNYKQSSSKLSTGLIVGIIKFLLNSTYIPHNSKSLISEYIYGENDISIVMDDLKD